MDPSLLRLETRNRALQQALRVPWLRVYEAASSYSDWHVFALWVRATCETRDEVISQGVAVELTRRCPGFLEWEQYERTRRPHDHSVWRCLVNWIADHRFAEASEGGWYDAVVHFAYKQLRTVQAWNYWQRIGAEWPVRPPERCPSAAEWAHAVDSVTEAAEWGDEDACRALASLGRTSSEQLTQAVDRILEARGSALWKWSFAASPTLFRMARQLDAPARTAALRGRWLPALRYQVIHHPKYHRLVHYAMHCRTEYARFKPRSVPTYPEWSRACDQYCVP